MPTLARRQKRAAVASQTPNTKSAHPRRDVPRYISALLTKIIKIIKEREQTHDSERFVVTLSDEDLTVYIKVASLSSLPEHGPERRLSAFPSVLAEHKEPSNQRGTKDRLPRPSADSARGGGGRDAGWYSGTRTGLTGSLLLARRCCS